MPVRDLSILIEVSQNTHLNTNLRALRFNGVYIFPGDGSSAMQTL